MSELMAPPADATPASRAAVGALADNVVDLVRVFNRARARWLAAAAHDVEWSAHVLLRTLRAEGPIRASALAEAVQSDPSTVSRQVAALVKEGLLERRADPDDGRACLLVLTDKADDVLADHDEIRLNHFAEMLGDWDGEDIATLAALMQRFTETYENAKGLRPGSPRAGSTD